MTRSPVLVCCVLSAALACTAEPDAGATSDGTTTDGTTTGSDSDSEGSTATTGTTASSGSSSTTGLVGGCGKDPGFSGRIDGAFTVDGQQREFIISLPEPYDNTRAYPLVFGFHGRGSNANQATQYFGVEEASGGDAAIFVYPQGLPVASMGGQTGWDLSGAGPDVKFFNKMADEFTNNLCVDEQRIFSTGHSFGGYFSNTLGCARGDIIRAIAPVAGGGPFGLCKGTVAAWITHGMSDGTVPFSQGEGARDHWLGSNGCGDTTMATTPDPCVAYDGCMDGNSVIWCPHDEQDLGGHGWPSYAPQAIWDFFASF